jgi:hypothetical protein
MIPGRNLQSKRRALNPLPDSYKVDTSSLHGAHILSRIQERGGTAMARVEWEELAFADFLRGHRAEPFLQCCAGCASSSGSRYRYGVTHSPRPACRYRWRASVSAARPPPGIPDIGWKISRGLIWPAGLEDSANSAPAA